MLDQELAGELCGRAGPVCAGFVIMLHCTIGFSHLHTIGLAVALQLQCFALTITSFCFAAASVNGQVSAQLGAAVLMCRCCLWSAAPGYCRLQQTPCAADRLACMMCANSFHASKQEANLCSHYQRNNFLALLSKQ